MKLKLSLIFVALILVNGVVLSAEEHDGDESSVERPETDATSEGDQRDLSKKKPQCYLGRPGSDNASPSTAAKSGTANDEIKKGGDTAAWRNSPRMESCNKCHGDGKSQPAVSSAEAAAKKVESGDMPKGQKLADAEKADLASWFRSVQ